MEDSFFGRLIQGAHRLPDFGGIQPGAGLR
jgi:hypothetical protein